MWQQTGAAASRCEFTHASRDGVMAIAADGDMYELATQVRLPQSEAAVSFADRGHEEKRKSSYLTCANHTFTLKRLLAAHACWHRPAHVMDGIVFVLPSARNGGEEKATSKETPVSQQPLTNFKGTWLSHWHSRTEESESFSPWLNSQANLTDRSQFNLYSCEGSPHYSVNYSAEGSSEEIFHCITEGHFRWADLRKRIWKLCFKSCDTFVYFGHFFISLLMMWVAGTPLQGCHQKAELSMMLASSPTVERQK